MTPLAARLAKQLIVRPKQRVGIWRDDGCCERLKNELSDIHCFEVSACLPLLAEMKPLIADEKSDALFEDFSFLPAPRTWIEWRRARGRVGVLLKDSKQYNDKYDVTAYWEEGGANIGYASKTQADYWSETFAENHPLSSDPGYLIAGAKMFLLLINSPQIVGRTVHMPNAGLERRMLGHFGGSFPLQAWTEILLQVNKPIDIDDGEEHEAHLTGKRALHFVRKHIRIRLGRMEYVRAHWRGDEQLGIKQSRYVVKPKLQPLARL